MNKIIIVLSFLLLIPIVLAFNTLSVGEIDFQNGRYWVMLISESGDTDYALALTRSETVPKEDLVEGDMFSTANLKIETEVKEEKCIYDFNTYSKDELYNLEIVFDRVVPLWNVDPSYDECRVLGNLDGLSPAVYFVKVLTSNVLYARLACYSENLDSFYAPIQFNSYIFKEEITVQPTGKSEEVLCLSNNYQVTGCSSTDNTANGDVIAQWVGSYSSGRRCPDADEDNKVGILDGKQWWLADSTNIGEYLRYKDGGFSDCVNSVLNGPGNGDYKINQINSICQVNYNNILVEGKKYVEWRPTWESPNTFPMVYDDQVKFNVAPLEFPSFTLKVDAEWVGIVSPACDPDIREFTKVADFKTGEEGLLKLTVKNKASFGTGSCVTSLSCESPITADQTDTMKIEGRYEETAFLTVGGVAPSKVCKTCTITVKDAEDSSLKDTDTATICVLAQVICDEGDKRCFGKEIIQECQTNVWTDIAECPSGENCVNPVIGDPKCQAGPPPPPPGKCGAWIEFGGKTIIPNLWCLLKEALHSYLMVVGVVLGIITGLLLFLTGRSMVTKFSIVDDNLTKGALIIGSILGGFLVGYLAYMFWWLGLLILIGLLVIKVII